MQGSGNGVFLNGQKLQSGVTTPMRNGDIVEIGKDRCGLRPPTYKFKFYKKAKLNLVKGDGKRSHPETAAQPGTIYTTYIRYHNHIDHYTTNTRLPYSYSSLY